MTGIGQHRELVAAPIVIEPPDDLTVDVRRVGRTPAFPDQRRHRHLSQEGRPFVVGRPGQPCRVGPDRRRSVGRLRPSRRVEQHESPDEIRSREHDDQEHHRTLGQPDEDHRTRIETLDHRHDVLREILHRPSRGIGAALTAVPGSIEDDAPAPQRQVTDLCIEQVAVAAEAVSEREDRSAPHVVDATVARTAIEAFHPSPPASRSTSRPYST